MIIGVPKEIKTEEYRVGLTPYSVKELISHGHEVWVEHDAGRGINFNDDAYKASGAKIAKDAKELYEKAEMIVKVKELQASEFKLLRKGQVLMTYLHLAPDLAQAEALIQSGCVAIGIETVTSAAGGLPLLAPMSQIAGRLAIQAGAHYLEKPAGGNGLLLGGIPGVYPGKVTVIGAGVVGTNAIRMALGKEAQVTVLDKSLKRLQELDLEFAGRLNTAYADEASIEQHVIDADLIIGAVLIPGEAAPKLVPREMLKKMRPGAVMVDVSIDQGGCFETSRPTTHRDPIYVIDNVIHYCVSNMPGAVPLTSTLALNNATLPFVIELADKGYRRALYEDQHLQNGLNVYRGHITHRGVAKALNKPYVSAVELLK